MSYITEEYEAALVRNTTRLTWLEAARVCDRTATLVSEQEEPTLVEVATGAAIVPALRRMADEFRRRAEKAGK